MQIWLVHRILGFWHQMILWFCECPLQKHVVDVFLRLLRLLPLQFSKPCQLPLIQAIPAIEFQFQGYKLSKILTQEWIQGVLMWISLLFKDFWFYCRITSFEQSSSGFNLAVKNGPNFVELPTPLKNKLLCQLFRALR